MEVTEDPAAVAAIVAARMAPAPAINSAQARIERQLRGERPPWSGFFSGVRYEIPEHTRAFRYRLM